MDKKIIFILVLLAIIAIALIFYLKKNSESWKIQSDLNLAFAKKLGIPVVDTQAEVIENKTEQATEELTTTEGEITEEIETQENILEQEQITTEPEVTTEVTTEPEVTTEEEITTEPEVTDQTEIVSEQEVAQETNVLPFPEETAMTVVHNQQTSEPVVESTNKNKKSGAKNKNENSERRVNNRNKKKVEEEGKDLVNPVPLHDRITIDKKAAPKEGVQEKINKLKKLQKNTSKNDTDFGSGE